MNTLDQKCCYPLFSHLHPQDSHPVQSATNSNTGQAFLSDAAELDIAQVGANKPQSEGGGQGDSIHCYLETFVSSDVKTWSIDE